MKKRAKDVTEEETETAGKPKGSGMGGGGSPGWFSWLHKTFRVVLFHLRSMRSEIETISSAEGLWKGSRVFIFHIDPLHLWRDAIDIS